MMISPLRVGWTNTHNDKIAMISSDQEPWSEIESSNRKPPNDNHGDLSKFWFWKLDCLRPIHSLDKKTYQMDFWFMRSCDNFGLPGPTTLGRVIYHLGENFDLHAYLNIWEGSNQIDDLASFVRELNFSTRHDNVMAVMMVTTMMTMVTLMMKMTKIMMRMVMSREGENDYQLKARKWWQ